MGCARCSFDVGQASVRASIANVVRHCPPKQCWLLCDQCKLLAKVVGVELVDGLIIEQNLPVLGVIEAQKQVEQGGFTCTGRANDSYFFT